jgi:lipopolysaccharide transport system permease protein
MSATIGPIYRGIASCFPVLAWRDLAVRYKQTLIGAWSIIRPVYNDDCLHVIFGRIARLLPDGTAPDALMVFAGMLPDVLFDGVARSLQQPN